MNHRWLTLLSIGGITLMVFIFFIAYLQPIQLPEIETPIEIGTLTEPTVTFVNPSKGAEEPVIQIVEFSDFQCSACKTIAPTLDAIVMAYPDQVQLVWKNLPNESIHQLATPAAIAAHCANQQGKFWEYHDELYTRQTFLTEEQLTTIASTIGLDMGKFSNCNSTRDTLPIVKNDYNEALGLGLTSTPTLFVGDEMVIGAITLTDLMSIVEAQLNK
jgi:protein-disulfide isomerase